MFIKAIRARVDEIKHFKSKGDAESVVALTNGLLRQFVRDVARGKVEKNKGVEGAEIIIEIL